MKGKKLTEYNALNLPHSTPILSNRRCEIVMQVIQMYCQAYEVNNNQCAGYFALTSVTNASIAFSRLNNAYFPPSIAHAFMPLDLRVPSFHMRPAGITTPAVWLNDMIDAFDDSSTAPGSLFKTSIGWKPLLPTLIMTAEAGNAVHLHSMKKSSRERASRRTRWQLGRAVLDDEKSWHIIFSLTLLWKATNSDVT